MAILLKVGNQQFELADTLRVVYALKDISGAKSLRDALSSIQNLDLDGQLRLLYAAYKANAKDKAILENEFNDLLLDNMGVFAVANAVEQLAEGLMYAGLSKEETQRKKEQMTEMTHDLPGVTSSVKDSE